MVNETEEQQIAELKKWWSENGTSIIIGVCLGLAVVFGGRSWLAYQGAQAERASTIYTTLSQGIEARDEMLVRERASILMTEHASSNYAAFAAMALAKISITKGDLDAAAAQLHWVLDNSADDLTRDIARLRLARVLLSSDKLEEAEAQLQAPRSSDAFDNLYDEVAGDIYSEQGDVEKANAAYQRALAATPAGTPGFRLLQLKSGNVQASTNVISEVSQ